MKQSVGILKGSEYFPYPLHIVSSGRLYSLFFFETGNVSDTRPIPQRTSCILLAFFYPRRFLLEPGDFSLQGLHEVLGFFFPALGDFLLRRQEAREIHSGAQAALLQLLHAGIEPVLLQAVLLLHLRELEGGQQRGGGY